MASEFVGMVLRYVSSAAKGLSSQACYNYEHLGPITPDDLYAIITLFGHGEGCSIEFSADKQGRYVLVKWGGLT